MNHIEYEYREWLIELSSDLCRRYGSYKKLFEYLYSVPFYSRVDNDRNRAEDGMDLRDQFAEERHYDYDLVRHYISGDCSVLELMIALAARCEQIMRDFDIGDRTDIWFFDMIQSLHLNSLNDQNFNEEEAEVRLGIFLKRAYKRNGDGGLFTVYRRRNDMRKQEIWVQMCWYLEELGV